MNKLLLTLLLVVSSSVFAAGSTNPEVTQETIKTTICKTGWAAKIRPPSSYTTSLKKKQLASIGIKKEDYPKYVEDHIIPLSVGGNPRDEANLAPQLFADSKKKDVYENSVHKSICKGTVSLAEGQLVFTSGSWQSNK